MWEYLKRHEAFVKGLLDGGQDVDWAQLKAFHARQLSFLQHERLVHLIVYLAVCLFTLLTIGFAAVYPSLAAMAASALLLVLVTAYTVHYFRLENGVQRWYHLSNQIDEKLGVVSARYNEDHPGPYFAK